MMKSLSILSAATVLLLCLGTAGCVVPVDPYYGPSHHRPHGPGFAPPPRPAPMGWHGGYGPGPGPGGGHWR